MKVEANGSMLVFALWLVVGYAAGALPFSHWLATSVLKRDLRHVGDGNPGATNVLKAGGPLWGLLALSLDWGKGFVPLLGAMHSDVSGWLVAPLALAAPLGHATSPLLRGRGGKAVATTAGTWAALAGWPGAVGWPVALVGVYLLQAEDAWSVLLAHSLWGLWLLAADAPHDVLGAWGLQLVLLAWTHRLDLRAAGRPRLRRSLPWIPSP